MFQINASLNRSAIEDVLQGLYEEGIQGVTMTNAVGRGCTGELDCDLREKVLLTILVPNAEYKDIAMEAIRANAQDTEHGSGKMWVTPVLQVERIRTGEVDTNALADSKPEAGVHPIDAVEFNHVDTPAS